MPEGKLQEDRVVPVGTFMAAFRDELAAKLDVARTRPMLPCTGCGKVVMLDTGDGKSGLCPECDEIRMDKILNRDRGSSIHNHWLSTDPMYPKVDLARIDQNGREVVLGAIRRSVKGDNGVWLFGPSGNGKTHILCGIGNYWVSKGKFVSFRSYSMFTSSYHRDWQPGAKWREYTNIPPSLLEYSFGDVILLDDLTPTGRVMDLHAKGFLELLDLVAKEGKRLYVTGNLDDVQLEASFGGGVEGQRVVSRILALCEPIIVRGEDRRTKWLRK